METGKQGFASSDDVYEYLNRFLNFERRIDPKEYRLDRMIRLKQLLGRPDEAYRIVHVAGSKGKGSTSTMIAAILQSRSGPIGLFTSPHLLDFTERIAVDGQPVALPLLLDCAETLASRMAGREPAEFPGGETPTYFELLTILGFMCFKAAQCKWSVIEVGLGGRLDSTNVVMPEASVIMPIEREHTEILGDTIPKIATEKAGIIKPGVAVFTSIRRPEALSVIRTIAAERKAPLTVLDEVAAISDVQVNRGGTAGTIEFADRAMFPHAIRLRTPMIGRVQLENATLAALVTRHLGADITAIQSGIARARLRARFEIIDGTPPVVLDGAHTPDSIQACVNDFSTIYPDGGVLLFGCAKDKQVEAMAAILAADFDRVIVTMPGTFKESDIDMMAEAFRQSGMNVVVVNDTLQAIEMALAEASARALPVLVTGSFYLCARLARVLQDQGR
jgi:dihydrofolate synthase/folylpolyglutamate synthase